MAPIVQYAKSGEVHIAYQVIGAGPIDVVWAPGAVSHLDLLWESPYQARFYERLSTFCRLILFDKRGTGLSDRPAAIALLEELIDDIRAIMDAAHSESAHLVGASEGGTMACLFAATYPQRTRSLLLYGPNARGTRAPDYPWGFDNEEVEKLIQRTIARGFQLDVTSPHVRGFIGAVGNDPAFMEWFARLHRMGVTPAARIELIRWNAVFDIRDILPTIQAPTLVVVRENDPNTPVDEARYITDRIPGARLRVLPGEGHFFWDIWEEMGAVIQEFITGSSAPILSRRVLTTILVIDIAGSTERATAIGDKAWADVLQRFQALAWRALTIFGGAEVDTAGDSLLATFDGPARAIRCARTIQREIDPLGLTIRAGVHTGEVERANGAIRGVAVHTAARIAALASAGEILVSSTVKDLVAGAGLSFEDRGTHTLKGLPEPKHVLAVSTV